MKNDRIFELKTLFDPLSKEWEKTNYEEKRKLLEEVIGNNQVIQKGFVLQMYIVDSMYFNSKGDFVQPTEEEMNKANDEDRQPLVSFNNLLLAAGFYLNKSIDKSFEFPDKIAKAQLLFSEMEQLKDGRRKRTQAVRDFLFEKSHGNTRELFDFIGPKMTASNIDAKILKFKNFHASGIAPIEILFMHVYTEVKDYHVREAPYSAFALCWNGNELF